MDGHTYTHTQGEATGRHGHGEDSPVTIEAATGVMVSTSLGTLKLVATPRREEPA